MAGLDLGTGVRLPPPPVTTRTQEPPPSPVSIHSDTENPPGVTVTQSGALRIENEDGSVTIDPTPVSQDTCDDTEHFANLADGKIDAMELQKIADDLLRKIADDDMSREPWVQNQAAGIDLLGIELKMPQSTGAGAMLAGTSKVVHPILNEACLRFAATARGELLPADGPVKVRDDNDSPNYNTMTLAMALQKDLNHYLTVTASEYYPDTDRLLYGTGFSGCGFKKIFYCPIKRRPVSESVPSKDLIVSNAATDLRSCGRITQKIVMRPAIMRRMQILGVYRDIPLVDAMPITSNAIDAKIQQTQGTQPIQQQSASDPKERDRDLYECYCELDIPGLEHKDEDGKVTGLPVPYKVTIDIQARAVLEVCRNYEEDDDLCLAKNVYVKYPFAPGFGFYDLGLLAIMGNVALAATAGWREMLDAGAFSCYPGFLYLKALGHQLTNEFRVPPGGGLPIDATTDDIRKAIQPLPYSPPNAAMMSLVQDIIQTGERLGGVAELQAGEGRQDVPVGTTLAMIEQANKVLDAVHKRLHQAQAEEFRMLRDVFKEHPESLWKHNKKSACLRIFMAEQQDTAVPDGGTWSNRAAAADAEGHDELMKQKFIAALSDCELVPQADPNTSSNVTRILRAMTLVQMAQQNPDHMDVREALRTAVAAMDFGNVEKLVPPPPPAPPGGQPDPMLIAAQAQEKIAQSKQMDSQTKQQEAQTKAGKLAFDSQRAGAQDTLKKMEITTRESVARLNAHAKMVNDERQRAADHARGASDHMNRQQETAVDSFHRTQDRIVDDKHRHLDRLADMQTQTAQLGHDRQEANRDQANQNRDHSADQRQKNLDRMLNLAKLRMPPKAKQN